MVQYKWVALSNTTIGVLMATINTNIVLISLPAIFRGINIDPLTSFQYLLWILFGYSIVTATLLVTFGRISDIFGRVRLYNLGFAIFTAGSIALFLTPNNGDLGALEIIGFRVIQGVGAAFLFSNSAAIITDAFPAKERGKALGINQVSALTGSLIGLILGGVLSAFNWRYVFLVSVPIGLIGTAWSYWKLKEIGSIRGNQKIDVVGNVVFGAGLTLILIGVTYGLLPYESSAMGWSNPWVIASFTAGAALLAVFPFIERRVQEPMFRLELFKIRMFSAANFAGLLSSISRGGVMIMLTILLQGIWLPLHGFSYEDTPFWAGVFMIPMLVGFILMGPISGWLSDKYGARGFATVAMIITAVSFLALTLLPYNFDYLQFAVIIFFMGVGGGMFAAPNTASIMNSVPPEHRGVASGMMATLQNIGQTSSLALFFTIVITSLANNLPAAFTSAMTKIGVPQLAPVFSQIPPTGALFAAFLGYNPMQTVINQLPDSLVKTIAQSLINHLTGFTFFPNIIAPAFMSALKQTFYLAAALSITAALFSVMRGRIYVHGSEARTEDEERKS
ncbi:MAG: MFS transporter [Thaumarchaeota archaeon]|nr:MFS transporter [Nitrososphaerota archaeon]MCL5317623.1 MFS transporter [Nitrososphaerota archaeon]